MVVAEVVVVEAGMVVEVAAGADVEVVELLTGPVVLVPADPPDWVGGAVVVGAPLPIPVVLRRLDECDVGIGEVADGLVR